MSDSSSSTRDDQLDISQIDRIDSLVDTTPPVEVAILDGRSGPVASDLTPVDRQISSVLTCNNFRALSGFSLLT